MATNDRVQHNLDDRYFGQLAPSQANRTNFTPGKAISKAGDQNWPLDYLIPTSNAALDVAGPRPMQRVRIELLGRNIICNQTLTSVPAHPETTTQINDGKKERTAGYEWPRV